MNHKSFYSAAGTVFLIVAVVHALRVLYGWQVTVDTFAVPMWWSWVAVLVAGYLAYHGLQMKKK